MAEARKKLVKNLVPWAGHDFSHAPGDHIELPADTANARIAAGLAAEPDMAATMGDNTAKLRALVAERDAKITDQSIEIDGHVDAHADKDAKIADLENQLAASALYVEALRKQITDLGEEPIALPATEPDANPEGAGDQLPDATKNPKGGGKPKK